MKKFEIPSKLPLVEILGENRILIENHLGVAAYSLEEIDVKVYYGTLSICGQGLCFAQINHNQMVINGKIETVTLLRR